MSVNMQNQKIMKKFQKSYPPPPKKRAFFLGGGGKIIICLSTGQSLEMEINFDFHEFLNQHV